MEERPDKQLPIAQNQYTHFTFVNEYRNNTDEEQKAFEAKNQVGLYVVAWLFFIIFTIITDTCVVLLHKLFMNWKIKFLTATLYIHTYICRYVCECV